MDHPNSGMIFLPGLPSSMPKWTVAAKVLLFLLTKPSTKTFSPAASCELVSGERVLAQGLGWQILARGLLLRPEVRLETDEGVAVEDLLAESALGVISGAGALRDDGECDLLARQQPEALVSLVKTCPDHSLVNDTS